MWHLQGPSVLQHRRHGDFVKKELVLPGFGLADETSMFWVNQYAWISGRN